MATSELSAGLRSARDVGAAHTSSSRLLSVDVFRGIAVAGMLLVDYPGDEAAGYWPIRHSPWNGWTPADLIFPSFVFLMGISIVLSLFDPPKRNPPIPKMFSPPFPPCQLFL